MTGGWSSLESLLNSSGVEPKATSPFSRKSEVAVWSVRCRMAIIVSTTDSLWDRYRLVMVVYNRLQRIDFLAYLFYERKAVLFHSAVGNFTWRAAVSIFFYLNVKLTVTDIFSRKMTRHLTRHPGHLNGLHVVSSEQTRWSMPTACLTYGPTRVSPGSTVLIIDLIIVIDSASAPSLFHFMLAFSYLNHSQMLRTVVCLAFVSLALISAVEKDHIADAHETTKLMMAQGADASACKDLAQSSITKVTTKRSYIKTHSKVFSYNDDTKCKCTSDPPTDSRITTKPYPSEYTPGIFYLIILIHLAFSFLCLMTP